MDDVLEDWRHMVEASGPCKHLRMRLELIGLSSLDAVLDGVAATCRARVEQSRQLAGALRQPLLDQVLAKARWLPAGSARDDMLRWLVGIRLGLFPGARERYDPSRGFHLGMPRATRPGPGGSGQRAVRLAFTGRAHRNRCRA